MNTIISKPTIGTQNPIDRQIASSYRSAFASHAEKLGGFILRYGLVAILLYFGAYKFTTEEAQGIAPLVAHSPLFNWLQASFGTQGISNLIGSSEIVIALLIATRPFSARLSSIGSILAVGTFLPTLSFVLGSYAEPGLDKRCGLFCTRVQLCVSKCDAQNILVAAGNETLPSISSRPNRSTASWTAVATRRRAVKSASIWGAALPVLSISPTS
jgi:Protein of unknown function, DUF417